MSSEKPGLNIKKFALTIFALTALIIFALAIFKESQKVVKPVPLHTPLPGDPDAEASGQSEDDEENEAAGSESPDLSVDGSEGDALMDSDPVDQAPDK